MFGIGLHEASGAVVYYYLLVAIACGLLTCKALNETKGAVPYTVALFVQGLILGLIHREGANLGHLSTSIEMWCGMDPQVLLYIFLPCLLFGDTMSLTWEYIKGCSMQCLLLAGPGVAFGSLCMALVAQHILPYGWDFSTSLCFGSILAATDSAAMAGILGDLGASKALTMQLAGEGLLNDGSAIVLWSLASRAMWGGHYTAAEVLGTASRLVAGGVAMGVACGLLAIVAIACCSDCMEEQHYMLQLAATMVCAFASFYLAEHEASCSGVLAAVSAALVIARMGWHQILDREGSHTVWLTVEFVAKTLIFFQAGTVVGAVSMGTIRAEDWGWLLVVYIFCMLIRAAMMALFYPILRHIGFSTNWKDMLVVTCGGLRGAVGLVLALAVNRDSRTSADKGGLFIFFLGGVASLTLTVNATCCKKLVYMLGMTEHHWARTELLRQLKATMELKTRTTYCVLSNAPLYVEHNRETITAWITPLRNAALAEEEAFMAATAAGKDGAGLTDMDTDGAVEVKLPRPVAAVANVDPYGGGGCGGCADTDGLPLKPNAVLQATADGGTRGPCDQLFLLADPQLQKGEKCEDSLGDQVEPADHSRWDQDGRSGLTEVAKVLDAVSRCQEGDFSIFKAMSTVRLMFYSMLRAEYWEHINDGRLPRNKRSTPLVLSVVDKSEMTPHVPICDVDHVLRSFAFATSWRFKPGPVLARMLRNVRDATLVGKYYVPVRRGNAIFDLFTCVCIMDAHEAVERKLRAFDWINTTILRDSTQIVLAESQSQIQLMKRFLSMNRVGVDLLGLVRTQQLAQALLHESEVLVQRWVAIGIMMQHEVDGMLEDVLADNMAVWASGSLHPATGESWWNAPDADLPLQVPPEVTKGPVESVVRQGNSRLSTYKLKRTFTRSTFAVITALPQTIGNRLMDNQDMEKE